MNLRASAPSKGPYNMNGTWQRRLLWALALAVTVLYLCVEYMDYARPCSTHRLQCNDESIAGITPSVALFVTYITFFGIVLHRFWYTSIRRGQTLKQPDHWTAAASRDVFLECSKAVKVQHDVALATLIPFSVTTATARAFSVAVDVTKSHKRIAPEVVGTYLLETCGPSYNLCYFTWVCRVPVVQLMAGTLLYLVCVYITTPVGVWTPTLQAAATKVGNRHLRRLRVLPWATIVFGVLSWVLIGFYYIWDLKMTASQLKMCVFMMAAQTLLQIVVMLWVSEVTRITTAGHYAVDCCKAIKSMIGCMWSRMCRASSCEQFVVTQDDVLWTHPVKPHQTREIGVRQRQLVQLVVHIFLWSSSSSTPALWYNMLLWVVRGVSLVLLLFTRDVEAGFGDLDRSPAFGIVVDKRDLCKAIAARLNGLEFHGKVRRYKGSIFRMRETVKPS